MMSLGVCGPAASRRAIKVGGMISGQIALAGIAAAFAGTFAAEVTIMTKEPPPDRESYVCNFKMGGEIRAGDFTNFVKAREQLDESFSRTLSDASPRDIIKRSAPVLCLEGPGGSYPEALKIAEYLLDKEEAAGAWGRIVKTVIEEGSECYSACALIFMAGKNVGRRGSPYPNRHLHVRGKLGFHAPSLDPTALLSKGILSRSQMEISLVEICAQFEAWI